MKILHIATPQTFTKAFFSLIEDEFIINQHEILTRGKTNRWPLNLKIKNETVNGILFFLRFYIKANFSDKIILHNLSDPRIVMLLFTQPWLLKKCYWVVWGTDLYRYKLGKKNWKWRISEFFRYHVLKRIGKLVTFIDGDVALARKWYKARGEYHKSIMYPSNVYCNSFKKSRPHKTINIQIGNSANPSNNHFEIMDKLLPHRDQNIKIYAPISYGDPKYAQAVICAGQERFGKKFTPLTGFMPFEQYSDFLEKIDIALFNHKRQQAMGNIINLVGMGKKVYLRNDVTSWEMLRMIGVTVYNISKIDLEPIDIKTKRRNQTIIRSHFSKQNLVDSLKSIFEG